MLPALWQTFSVLAAVFVTPFAGAHEPLRLPLPASVNFPQYVTNQLLAADFSTDPQATGGRVAAEQSAPLKPAELKAFIVNNSTCTAQGDNLSYQVIVRNYGDLPAHNITVQFKYPEGTNLLNVEPKPTHELPPERIIEWFTALLPPGGSSAPPGSFFSNAIILTVDAPLTGVGVDITVFYEDQPNGGANPNQSKQVLTSHVINGSCGQYQGATAPKQPKQPSIVCDPSEPGCNPTFNQLQSVLGENYRKAIGDPTKGPVTCLFEEPSAAPPPVVTPPPSPSPSPQPSTTPVATPASTTTLLRCYCQSGINHIGLEFGYCASQDVFDRVRASSGLMNRSVIPGAPCSEQYVSCPANYETGCTPPNSVIPVKPEDRIYQSTNNQVLTPTLAKATLATPIPAPLPQPNTRSSSGIAFSARIKNFWSRLHFDAGPTTSEAHRNGSSPTSNRSMELLITGGQVPTGADAEEEGHLVLIKPGDIITLTWQPVNTAGNVRNCIASAEPAYPDWNGPKPLRGSQTIAVTSFNIDVATFNLNCTDDFHLGSPHNHAHARHVVQNSPTPSPASTPSPLPPAPVSPLACRFPQLGVRFREAINDIIPGDCRVLSDDVISLPQFQDALNRRGDPAARFMFPLYQAGLDFRRLILENELLGIDHSKEAKLTLRAIHTKHWQKQVKPIQDILDGVAPTSSVRSKITPVNIWDQEWRQETQAAQQDLLKTYLTMQTARKKKFDPVATKAIAHAKESMIRACGPPVQDGGLTALLPTVKVAYENNLDQRVPLFTTMQAEFSNSNSNNRSKENRSSEWQAELLAALDAFDNDSPKPLQDYLLRIPLKDSEGFTSGWLATYEKYYVQDREADDEVRLRQWERALDTPKTAATKCEAENVFPPKVATTWCESGSKPEFIIKEAPQPAQKNIRPPAPINGGAATQINDTANRGQSCSGLPGDPWWAADCSCHCGQIIPGGSSGLQFCQDANDISRPITRHDSLVTSQLECLWDGAKHRDTYF